MPQLDKMSHVLAKEFAQTNGNPYIVEYPMTTTDGRKTGKRIIVTVHLVDEDEEISIKSVGKPARFGSKPTPCPYCNGSGIKR